MQALDAPRSRAFQCPRTGVELVAILPSRRTRREAAAAAAKRWGDREVKTQLDAVERLAFNDEEILARAILLDGSPIGLEAVDRLDETTLDFYERQIHDLVEQADPAAETWTEADVDALVAEIKKNAPTCEDTLKSFGGAKLRGLVRSLVDRLSRLETSTSST